MKLDGLTQTSPATEGGCRRQNPDGIRLESEMKRVKACRRKRMELQRVRSLSEGVPPKASSSSDDDVSCPEKKVKSDRDAQLELISPKVAGENETRKPKGGDAVTCVSHGSISVVGRRREMEDYVTVEQGFLNDNHNGTAGGKYDYFGVYDGHSGWRVARACAERLHQLVAEVATECGGGGGGAVDWEKVMVEGFRRMDEEVNKSLGKIVAMTGSTAVVAVVGSEEVVVANCGDSRAVMGRRGGEVVQLSDDHKPERPDELERIEVSGGKVLNWNGQRVLGVLAVSRSIGDLYLKPFVMAEPEVKVMKRSEEDEFFILASDGLWDVVSNDVACQVVRRCLDTSHHPFCCNNNNNIENSSSTSTSSDINSNNNKNNMESCGTSGEAAAVLAELAMARGSRDNISVIVVELNKKKNLD